MINATLKPKESRVGKNTNTESITDGVEDVAGEMGDEKLPYFGPGVYPEVELERVAKGIGKMSKEPYFKIQAKIVTAQPGATNAPGTSAVQVITKDKFNYYKKDILRFSAATIGEAPQKLTQGMIDELTADTQPAKGIKLRLEVTPKLDEDGNPTRFNLMRWLPLETQKN